MENMNGKSLNIVEQKKAMLQNAMPEVFTEGKIDWEKFKATLGEELAFTNERYVLNWAGKSEAFKVLQTPTTATLVPDRAESVNFDSTENIFIEGENLEVLKVLQKSYFGKIKMIYIDPPYNTGNDSFIYPDRFAESREDYLKRIGDKDEEGYLLKEGLFRKNSKDSGHYHSNWLSMMYPRLFLARNLLSEDGVIFVSIDDHEVHNLRVVMNEIFGEENFIATFVWQSKKGGGSDSSRVVIDQEYVLCFGKGESQNLLSRIQIEAEELDQEDEKGKYRRGRELNKWGSNSRRIDRPTMFFPIKHPSGEDVFPIRNDGVEGCWRWGKKKMFQIVEQGDVGFVKRENGTFIVYEKIRSKDPRSKPFRTWLTEVGATSDGSKAVKELFEGKKIFDFPKPLELLRFLIELGTIQDEDIVVDFFGGSASIAQAVLEYNIQNRSNIRFICVQIDEKADEKSEAYTNGYLTITSIATERIRRSISAIKIKQETDNDLFSGEDYRPDLGFKIFKLKPSNFKIWRGTIDTPEELTKQLDAFVDLTKPSALEENMLYEILLKTGRDLNSKVEKIACDSVEYYSINSGEMVVMLSKITDSLIQEVVDKRPQKVIALNKLFEGNDQLKTNTVLQMKDAGIDFRTI